MMKTLSCNCFNIQIDSVNFLDLDIKVPDLAILFSNEIFPQDSFKTYMKDCSLKLKNDFLTQVIQIGDWYVTMCLNCSQITHATSSNSINKLMDDESILNEEFIIISSNLKKIDENFQFFENPSYSQLFQMLIQKPIDPNLITAESNSTETISNLHKIQAKFDSFLSEEHLHLEERIKKYENDERSSFEKLKEKVRIEKNAIISTYLSSVKLNIFSKLKSKEDNNLSQIVPVFPVNPTKTLSPSRKFKHHLSNVILEETSEAENDDQTYQTSLKETIIKTNVIYDDPVKKIANIDQPSEHVGESMDSFKFNQSIQHIDSLHDITDVFEFENEEVYKRSFSESNSQDSEENNADTEDEGITSEKDFHMYSTSVPIGIPFQKQDSRQSQTSDSSNIFENEMSTEHMMAASIQALARSVCANDTLDVFGELPKPRTRIKLMTSISTAEDE